MSSSSPRTGNVRIAFRLRPRQDQEQDEYGCVHVTPDRGRVALRSNEETHHFTLDRVFDDKESQQQVFRTTAMPLVSDFVAGRNCCVMAYGETGSGKSHTMVGNRVYNLGTKRGNEENDDDSQTGVSSLGSAGVSRHPKEHASNEESDVAPPPTQVIANSPMGSLGHHLTRLPPLPQQGLSQPPPYSRKYSIRQRQQQQQQRKPQPPPLFHPDDSGIIPRVIQQIFELLYKKRQRKNHASAGNNSNNNEDPALRVSVLEVYTERVIDLLNAECLDWTDDADPKQSLVIRSDRERGVYAEDAIEETCHNPEEALTFLQHGLQRRDQRADKMNADASRSHTVVMLKLERFSRSRSKMVTSHFYLVDLANSGLVRKPPADTTELRVREHKSVKRSLGALRKCLRSLALVSERSSSAYGESTLTKLLHDSLVRGAGVYVLVTVNPLAKNSTESLSAIKYGAYVSGVRTDEISVSQNSHHDRKNGNHPPPHHHHSAPHRHNASQQELSTSSAHETKTTTNYGSSSRRSSRNNNVDNVNSGVRRASDTHHSLLSNSKTPPPPYAEISNPIAKSSSQEDLQQVSGLLEKATKRAEADYNTARQQLKAASGYDEPFSPEEMEQQLLEVTKELESMKYDGHLASQIQHDLAAAQEELKRIAAGNAAAAALPRNATTPPPPNNGSRTTTTTTTPEQGQPQTTNLFAIPTHFFPSSDEGETDGTEDVEALRRELQAVRRHNAALQQKQESQERELEAVRKELKESLVNLNDPFQLDTQPTVSTSSNTTEGSAVNNTVGFNYQVNILQEEAPWAEEDESEIDVGPSPVQVCLRLRPMTKLERNRRSRSCIEVHDGSRNFTVDSPLDGEYDFCYDHVFDVDSSQLDVYETVGLSIVENLVAGVNCAVMVYGLTGSGKSHTLSGKLPDSRDDVSTDSSDDDSMSSDGTPTGEDAGFAPRIIADLFRGMKDAYQTSEFRITCSFVCIYLEKMFDLLEPRFDKHLLVCDTTSGVQVEGAVEAFCFTDEDVIHLIRRGTACRKLIGSKLKIDHNRSHSILILNIEQRNIRTGFVKRSYLQLAELAGFEVSSKAKGQSVQETKIIHKSFSALGNVIKSLTEGNHHAPYRESKLTSVLKDALGGNCKTTLFITASPSSYNISETINSIRLGQRVRRVTNNPRVNKDASLDDYRKWLIHSEVRLGEITGYLKEFARQLVEANGENGTWENALSESTWSALKAIVDEEEKVYNPSRRRLLLEEDNDPSVEKPKWRSLSLALAKRLPSAKLVEAIHARDRAESLLTDIQSESVVLRRQNELLVQERRNKEEELGAAHRDNRKITLQNTELEHKLSLAENRAKDAIMFLRYMRTLCWKLRKDVERDRPIDINEITSCLQGAPDLSGLVDLDSLMIDAGYLVTAEMDIEKVEIAFFDYLQEAGLLIDATKIAEEDEVDDLDGFDDGIGSTVAETRWKNRSNDPGRSHPRTDGSTWSDSNGTNSFGNQEPVLFGVPVPWLRREAPPPEQAPKPVRHESVRHTRRERELQLDLQNMANKCVELQLELNEQRALVETLSNRPGTFQKKKLAQDLISIAKERDRMMHNAKAATWKLQELHVTNKQLSKQAKENKQQVKVLEEGFQRLQESFRGTVQDGLDADAQLRDRVKTLQGIVDSLTGPPVEDEDESDYSGSEDINPLNARINLPVRGRMKPREPVLGSRFVDPSGGLSSRKSLIIKFRGKRGKKRPEACVHHAAKHARRSRNQGNAFVGKHRARLYEAYRQGQELLPPLFLDDEDDDEDSVTTDDEYYDDD